MNEVNPEIKDTLDKVNKTWGGDFEISFIDDWKELVKRRKNDSARIVHLTMYGENINDVESRLEKEQDLLIVIGAEKVPREMFDLADYNVAIGSQPHSEISALAVLLDRILKGKKFSTSFDEAQRKIIPTKQGKNVVVKNTRN
jgi:tRNA (cytidine56-2'-O)-methyltransferase